MVSVSPLPLTDYKERPGNLALLKLSFVNIPHDTHILAGPIFKMHFLTKHLKVHISRFIKLLTYSFYATCNFVEDVVKFAHVVEIEPMFLDAK